MNVSFYEISDPTTLYNGDLTITLEGDGRESTEVYDLRIPRREDIKYTFHNLIIGQVITLIFDGRQIDFYKSVSNSSEHLVSTKP